MSHRVSGFVGRSTERSWLLQHIASLDEGRGGYVSVAGPPGVGKTRLLREVLQVQEHFWASTWEVGEAPALWPITQLLRKLAFQHPDAFLPEREVLSGLLDPAEKSTSPSIFALYQSIIQSVSRVAMEKPVLLVIDDIHAADRSTVELLTHAEPEWRSFPVLLLMTRRTVDTRTSPDAQRELARLIQIAEEFTLAGLTWEEVKAYATHLAKRDVEEDEVNLLHHRTGGLPLFVEGIMQTSLRGGLHGSLSKGALPPSIRTVLFERMSQFPDALLSLLNRAALLRDPLDVKVLSESLGMDPLEVDELMELALIEGVFSRVESTYSWTHQLFSEVLISKMNKEEKAEGHRALLDAMDAVGLSSLAARARHAIASQHPQASELVMAAGAEAESMYAYKAAADLYQRAALSLSKREEKCDALVARAKALHLAGEKNAAFEALQTAIRLDMDSRLPALACAIADMAAFAYGDDKARSLLRKALQTLKPDDHQTRSALLARLATQEMDHDPNQDFIESMLEESLLEAEKVGDAEVLADALVASLRFWRADRLDFRVKRLAALEALQPQLDHPKHRLEAARWKFNIALEQCDGVGAREALFRYERAAEVLRSPQAHLNAYFRRCILLQLEGRFDEIDGDLILQLGKKAGDPHTEYFNYACRAYGAALEGHTELLKQWTPVLVKHSANWSQYPGLLLKGVWLQLKLGEHEAVDSAYGVWKAVQFRRTPWWCHLHGLAILADIAIAREQKEDARLLIHCLQEYPEGYAGCGPMLPFGPTARFEAKLHRFLGQPEEAEAAKERALMLCERLGAPGIAALIEQEHGDVSRSHSTSFDLPPATASHTAAQIVVEMVREGDVWCFRRGEIEHRVKAVKGWSYIAMLVERAGEPTHVLELTSGPNRKQVNGDAGPLLDEKARKEYAKRAQELYEELSEAERNHDLGRTHKLQTELDFLTEELALATGLGGRSRPTASAAERARTSVKQAIRRALKGLQSDMPEVFEHLRSQIETGVLCRYNLPSYGLRVVVTS